MYEKVNLEPQFARVFLNLLLGRTNEFDDLSSYDHDLHKNLLQLADMEEGVEHLVRFLFLIFWENNYTS